MQDIELNPQNIWAKLLMLSRPLLPNHLIPTEKSFLLCAPDGMLCLCIHWMRVVVQNTKQHPFLIHADCVYTNYLRSLSFLLRK
jgi:hypothetical protein